MVALAPWRDGYDRTGGTGDSSQYKLIIQTGTTATSTNYVGTGDIETVPSTWIPIRTNYDVEMNGLVTQTIEYFTGTTATANNYYRIGTALESATGAMWDVVPYDPRMDRRYQLKQQHRHAPRLRGRPSFVDRLDPAEVKALQLLRSLVDAENFRRYLKYGFVVVQGMSGLSYCVYRSRNTIVFDGQNEVASLCVHLRDRKAPPTDEVIAKILMCECEEHEIWKRSNRSFRTKTPKITSLGFDKLPRAA